MILVRVARGVQSVTGAMLLGALAAGAPACKSQPSTTQDTSAAPTPRPRAPGASASVAASAAASTAASTAASGSAAPSGSASAASDGLPGVGPVLDLVDPGKPPLRELRYELTEGATVRVTETENARVEYENVQLPGHPLRRSRWVYEWQVTRAPENGVGETLLRVVEGAATSDPTTPAELTQQLGQLSQAWQRLTATQSLSTRGVVTSDLPEATAAGENLAGRFAQLGQEHLAALPFPLPERAVGVGARWTVVRQYEADFGLRIRELTVYELLKVEGDRVEFDGLVSASAPPSRLEHVALEKGQALDLVRLSLLGKVRGTLSLKHPFPAVRGEGTMKMSVKLRRLDEVVGEGTAVLTLERQLAPAGMTPPSAPAVPE